jgi:tRNA-modifying protein YgfZ
MFLLARDRALISVSGADRIAFLQGLVSNDVAKVSAGRALYAAFLTAQGKYLHDIFIAAIGERLLIECEAPRRPDLVRRLSLYKLRSQVALSEENGLSVGLYFGEGALGALGLPETSGQARVEQSGVVFVDPRLAALGARAYLSGAGLPTETATTADYDRLRISLGVPDGSRDLPVEKAILLEAGFDELNGVDWDKGCYMGQELTARTKYRALIRKRLMPVTVDGPLPESGTVVKLGDQEAGEIRSGRGDQALALLRLEAVSEAAKSGAPLIAGATRVTPTKPGWARF